MKTEDSLAGFGFRNLQQQTVFDEAAVRRFLDVAADDLAKGWSFTVVVERDERVRELNRSFRAVDRPTDVLSFPDGEGGYLGDIVISAGVAARQAAGQGHSVEEELKVLALHGLLHLAGYDHETDSGEMLAAEERLRSRYGLDRGLIGRASGRGD